MPLDDWQSQASSHRARAERWTEPHLERRRRGIKHPVEDFLFDYYPYSPAKLARWHPGHGVVLEGPDARAYLSLSGYRVQGADVTADLDWLRPRRARLDSALAILERTATHTPVLGCFALHEWAMTYRLSQEEVRHSDLPLRLTPEGIAATVDEIGLRCTHIDAYRFFTPAAVPLNDLVPTRASQPDLEQPGCLHASMDLYKYAFWFSPLVPSSLVLDCFENAVVARRLDMRASPYDVTAFGLEPIRVESPEGRREYADHQRELMSDTALLRARLQGCLADLRAALDGTATSGCA